MKKQLNPTLVYVLSVIGFLCCCFAGLGFLLSGPAYFIADKKIKDATANPDEYDGNINAMNTAKIVALIVTIINVLNFLWAIYSIATGGWEESQQQWRDMMEQINNQ
ncbi:CCC motif membrane protein [Kordia jejudonensis]|uniref:CCC motif membrane protein n=1 Tax=Kordia jejudonensis TaxID=1348245 RepID=UPI0006293DF8|nr:CCC motif membrane protein [Kordia jejudonensis]